MKKIEKEIEFHLERVERLTRTARLCRKLSNKLKLLAWINKHAQLATELRAKLNGWS
jgi:hypothetical protein